MFSTWRKLESPDRAPPLTKQIIYAWAYYAVDHCDFIFAGLLLLGFFALLRTGEILQVAAADILLDGRKGIISLRDTKTGKRDNVAEMVSFDDPFTIQVLQALKALKVQQGLDKVPIWPYSGSAFRHRFKQYSDKFNLDQHKFRPYSLRRGGATHLFQVNRQHGDCPSKRALVTRPSRPHLHIRRSQFLTTYDIYTQSKTTSACLEP